MTITYVSPVVAIICVCACIYISKFLFLLYCIKRLKCSRHKFSKSSWGFVWKLSNSWANSVTFSLYVYQSYVLSILSINSNTLILEQMFSALVLPFQCLKNCAKKSICDQNLSNSPCNSIYEIILFYIF